MCGDQFVLQYWHRNPIRFLKLLKYKYIDLNPIIVYIDYSTVTIKYVVFPLRVRRSRFVEKSTLDYTVVVLVQKFWPSVFPYMIYDTGT